jgi:16S rRNA (uracil1498-N3)-methyltransferase
MENIPLLTQRLNYPYFYNKEILSGVLSDISLFKHIIKSLRYTIGDKVVFYDGNLVLLCNITSIDLNKQTFKYSIESKYTYPVYNRCLIQGTPGDKNKLDFIAKYSTIAGYTQIIFVDMKRSNPFKYDKVRLETIGQNALNLSKIPIKINITNSSLKDIDFSKFNSIIIADEAEHYHQVSGEKENFAVIIGPEGGITDEERLIFKKYNSKFITLGDTNFPTELAGIIAIQQII